MAVLRGFWRQNALGHPARRTGKPDVDPWLCRGGLTGASVLAVVYPTCLSEVRLRRVRAPSDVVARLAVQRRLSARVALRVSGPSVVGDERELELPPNIFSSCEK